MTYRAVVHWQVAGAILALAIVVVLGTRLDPAVEGSRSDLLLRQAWAYALPLAIAVFAVMFERAGSPDAILGHQAAARPPGLRGAILQNTLEQAVLGALALAAFVGVAPERWLGFAPIAAGVFLAGRALFAVGYAISPMARFFGFALNFYASLALLAAAMGFALS